MLYALSVLFQLLLMQNIHLSEEPMLSVRLLGYVWLISGNLIAVQSLKQHHLKATHTFWTRLQASLVAPAADNRCEPLSAACEDAV